MSSAHPTFPLEEVQALGATEACEITVTAYDSMLALGLTSEDVWAAVAALQPSEFVKPMESTKFPGLMQDVYFTVYKKRPIYLKVQIFTHSKTKAKILRVISFKRNERYDD